jgi:KTSC domain-containing protein
VEHVQVKSGQVKSIGWESYASDIDMGTLEVKFTSGATYAYKNVPYNEYRGFLNADSKGSHFAIHIRPVYEFERVHAEGCGRRLQCTMPLCDCFCHGQRKEVSDAKPQNENLEKDLRRSIKAAKEKKRV